MKFTTLVMATAITLPLQTCPAGTLGTETDTDTGDTASESETTDTTGAEDTCGCAQLRGVSGFPGADVWALLDLSACADAEPVEVCFASDDAEAWTCEEFTAAPEFEGCAHVGGPDLGHASADAEVVVDFGAGGSSWALTVDGCGIRLGSEDDLAWTDLERTIVADQADPDVAPSLPIYCDEFATCTMALNTYPDESGCDPDLNG